MLRKEDFEPNMKTEDKIPGAQTENPAQSQRFGDFIVKYMQNVQDTMELFPGASFRAINEIFGVLYVPLESMGEIEVTGTSYNSIPKCYTYMDMEAAGGIRDQQAARSPLSEAAWKRYCGGGDRFGD